jgi:hypothetical protein
VRQPATASSTVELPGAQHVLHAVSLPAAGVRCCHFPLRCCCCDYCCSRCYSCRRTYEPATCSGLLPPPAPFAVLSVRKRT